MVLKVSTKEKREFQLRLKVRNKDDKIEELNKKTYLEITWEGDKGILNPGDLVTFKDAYGTFSHRPSEGEVVRFEKNGKNYDVLVKIDEIKKGWFKDKIKTFAGFWPAPGSDFTVEEKESKPIEQSPKRFGEETDMERKVRATQWRYRGFLLIGGGILLVLLIIIIYYYFEEKRTFRRN